MPLDERRANDMTLANRVYDLDLAIGDPVAWLSRDGRHITDEGTVLYVDRFPYTSARTKPAFRFIQRTARPSTESNQFYQTLAALTGSDQECGTQQLT
jgi:hypothetical protein